MDNKDLVPLELTPPEILRKMCCDLTLFVGESQISNDGEYAEAGKTLTEIREARKQIEDYFEPTVQARLKAHREATAARNAFTQPLDSVEREWKAKIARYAAEMQKRIDEQNAKARQEAEKQAESMKVEMAAALESAGQKAQAEAVLNSQMAPAIVAPAVVAPKAEGVSIGQKWDARVVDLKALVMAVAAGQAPLSLICADAKCLREFAKSTKGSMVVPGVEFFATATVRGAK